MRLVLPHLIIFESRSRVVIWAHIHFIEKRRLDLVSQRLHLFHIRSGDVIIAWDMWVDWINMSMACKNVTNVVLSNIRKVNLNWSLEVAFAKYIWVYLHDVSSMCKFLQGKKCFSMRTVMFFICTSNIVDINQNITFMIFRDFFFTLWTFTMGAHTKLDPKWFFFQSWSALHKSRNQVGIGKRKEKKRRPVTCESDIFTITIFTFSVALVVFQLIFIVRLHLYFQSLIDSKVNYWVVRWDVLSYSILLTFEFRAILANIHVRLRIVAKCNWMNIGISIQIHKQK